MFSPTKTCDRWWLLGLTQYRVRYWNVLDILWTLHLWRFINQKAPNSSFEAKAAKQAQLTRSTCLFRRCWSAIFMVLLLLSSSYLQSWRAWLRGAEQSCLKGRQWNCWKQVGRQLDFTWDRFKYSIYNNMFQLVESYVYQDNQAASSGIVSGQAN